MLSAADLARITALGAPVLCIDTCNILDILRDPTREGSTANEAQAAVDIVTALERGTDLVCLLAPQVVTEWNENLPVVEDAAKKAIKKALDSIVRMEQRTQVFGAQFQPVNFSHFNDDVERAIRIAERLMAASTLIIESPNVYGLAYSRVLQPRTPASQGNQSMKDCVVTETYLEAIRQLRAGNFQQKIAFVSSNTKDYCTPVPRTLKPDLAAEFQPLNVEYWSNLAAAKNYLGV